jgi:hypothetical protein
MNKVNIPSWNADTNEDTGSIYVYTYFPIHAIPDQGWGAVTMEIFTYQGIAAVIRNDYVGFCRWHRMYYYLLFVQNAGYMTNWKSNPGKTDNYETIDPNTAIYGGGQGNGYTDGTDAPSGFLPPYLDRNTSGYGSWVSGDQNKLKNYTVYTGNNVWPPEYDGNVQLNNTNYWANRIYPYRGGDNYVNYTASWTTPCYTVGYSPVWVACGIKNTYTGSDNYPEGFPAASNINDDTPSDKNNTASPLWEAANPYFSSDAGLYTATDADMNAFMAYKLASLKWDTVPSSTGVGNDSNGYDCDVADLDGVIAASTYLTDTISYTFNDTNSTKQLRIDEKIGYGYSIVTDDDNGVPILGFNTDKISTEDKSLTRHTTWKYMSVAIARCLVSTNGLAADGKYGNFVNHSNKGKNLVTLGRDTNNSAIKIDYIDPAAILMAKNIDPMFYSE